MTALALVEGDARPTLRVLDGGLAPKRGRPSAADDYRLEMAARRSEEQAMDSAMEPLMARLELIARQAGPVLWRTVAEVVHLQARHARRWSEDPESAA